MIKKLTKKFWSQGTSQGSPGSGSGADVRLGACQFQILVIWGPHEPPVLVALQAQAKKLKTVPAWCVFKFKPPVLHRTTYSLICLVRFGKMEQ